MLISLSYPDSALVYAQQALSLAEKLQDDNKIFWSIVAINGCIVCFRKLCVGTGLCL